MHQSYKVQPENNQAKRYQAVVDQYLSKDEMKSLLQKSNWKAALGVFNVWLPVIISFVVIGLWPNALTVILALFVIGAKQLGCAIIMHDASHHSLFKTKRLNEFVGNWFGAYPILHNVEQYRPYHLQHHKATGTDDDPDMNLVKGYPTSRLSMVRKFSRDLIGITGLKGNVGLMLMHLGIWEYNLGNRIIKIPKANRENASALAWKNLRGPLTANLLLFTICWAFGKPLLYLLWPIAYLTTYNFFLRIRSIAEHSMVSDTCDVLQNARTVLPNWFERFFLCPLHVNYHLEHHLLFAVPSYNFKEMHKMLWKRGLYESANYSRGYMEILRKVSTN